MHSDEEKSFERLKQIFLTDSEERHNNFQQELSELKFNLTDKTAKIENYYPIITDLLERKISESEEEVAKVLSPIMGKALKKEINESKEVIIDALYPIMGQTIKKYVAEAIKDIYTSINIKIDNALRRGIFSKQVKSKISGVSAADIILQESFPFSLDEIFLIHEKTGILISHVSSTSNLSSDADLISGMLTAIKDFVADSFKNERGDQNLNEIQYGDSRIILERGRHTYLALVVKGSEPADFDAEVSQVTKEIHEEYSKYLREFNGHFENLAGIDKPLKDLIEGYIQIPKTEKEVEGTEEPKPILLYLFGSLLFLLLLFLGIIKIPEYLNENKVNSKIESALLSLNQNEIKNITWTQDEGKVKLAGFVNSSRIRNKIDSLFNDSVGIESIENNINIFVKSIPPDSILNMIKNEIAKTSYIEGEKISYIVHDDEVIIDGVVNSLNDKREIGYLLSKIPGVRFLQNNLRYSNQLSLFGDEAESYLNELQFNFDFAKTEVTKEQIGKLEYVIPFLRNNDFRLTINSFADNEGDAEINIKYAEKRGENIKSYLTSRGVNKERIIMNKYPYSISKEGRINSRMIEFEINQ